MKSDWGSMHACEGSASEPPEEKDEKHIFFCRGFKLLIWLKIDSRNLLLAWWPSRCHWRYSPSPPRLTAQCQGEAPSCNPALHRESPSSPWWSSGTVWCSPPAPYLVSNRHCNSWTQTQRVSIIKRSLWLPLRLYSSACIFVFLRWKLRVRSSDLICCV